MREKNSSQCSVRKRFLHRRDDVPCLRRHSDRESFRANQLVCAGDQSAGQWSGKRTPPGCPGRRPRLPLLATCHEANCLVIAYHHHLTVENVRNNSTCDGCALPRSVRHSKFVVRTSPRSSFEFALPFASRIHLPFRGRTANGRTRHGLEPTALGRFADGGEPAAVELVFMGERATSCMRRN